MLPAAICEVGGALTVTFGPPVSLEPFQAAGEEAADAALDEVMLAVARLLPPSMHGAYAGRAEGEGRPRPERDGTPATDRIVPAQGHRPAGRILDTGLCGICRRG